MPSSRNWALYAWLLAFAIATPVSGQRLIVPADYRKFDVNNDSWLDSAELIAFAKAEEPSRTDDQATDVAVDILTYECSVACTRISFDRFIVFLQDRARRQQVSSARKRSPFWRGFGVVREVVDAVNPRGHKTKSPAVFSVKWDEEASESKGKRQETILGAVQLFAFGVGEGATRLSLTPGADFDIDGAKAANETTVTFGLPSSLLHVRSADAYWESFTLGMTPKHITDRAFEREVNELAFNAGFTAKSLAAGFIRPAPVRRDGIHLPPLTWYWVPAVQLELGRVRDAGGNAKLLPLEGQSYRRLAPRAKIVVFPNVVSEQLKLELDYTNRWDLSEDWNRHYLEARMSYDLVFKGTTEVTLVHRNGRRPPHFTTLNDLWLGIGIKL